MTLNEIKAAVDAGKTVHWGNKGYRVVKWRDGSYNIGWDIGGPRENYTGLTWTDGVTVNGKPEQFFIAPSAAALDAALDAHFASKEG